PSPPDRPGPVGLFENAEQRQAGLGRHDVLSLGNQETLFLQPADNLCSGRRRANALGLLQTLPQNLIVNKAPGILHRLDQSAFASRSQSVASQTRLAVRNASRM